MFSLQVHSHTNQTHFHVRGFAGGLVLKQRHVVTWAPPSTLRQRNLKTEVSLWKDIKCFPSTLRRRDLKTQQSLVILDKCLRKTGSGNSYDYVYSRDHGSIVFKKVSFQNVFRPQEQERPTFSRFLRFEWRISVDLTEEIKPHTVNWKRWRTMFFFSFSLSWSSSYSCGWT